MECAISPVHLLAYSSLSLLVITIKAGCNLPLNHTTVLGRSCPIPLCNFFAGDCLPCFHGLIGWIIPKLCIISRRWWSSWDPASWIPCRGSPLFIPSATDTMPRLLAKSDKACTVDLQRTPWNLFLYFYSKSTVGTLWLSLYVWFRFFLLHWWRRVSNIVQYSKNTHRDSWSRKKKLSLTSIMASNHFLFILKNFSKPWLFEQEKRKK